MFQKGNPKPPGSGRKPGQPNKHTQAVRDAIKAAYNGKTLVERLLEIAKEKPSREEDILKELLPYESYRLSAATVEADVTTHNQEDRAKEVADELERARMAKETLSLVKPTGTG